jgi:hypothetical protein
MKTKKQLETSAENGSAAPTKADLPVSIVFGLVYVKMILK